VSMGKVARYKKQKKVFDVEDEYDWKKNPTRDDPLKSKVLSNEESKTRQRNMVVKYGADGEPLNQRPRREPKETKMPWELPTKGSKIGEKRKDESLREFHIRIENEAQAKLNQLRASVSKRKIKEKEFLKSKKIKVKEKKQNIIEARRAKKEDDTDEKERRVYGANRFDNQPSLFDTADRPPEFTKAHNLRKRKRNPNDRERFAKLATGEAAVANTGGKNMGEYEKHQLEAMRLKVMSTYNDIKKKKYKVV